MTWQSLESRSCPRAGKVHPCPSPSLKGKLPATGREPPSGEKNARKPSQPGTAATQEALR